MLFINSSQIDGMMEFHRFVVLVLVLVGVGVIYWFVNV